MNKTGTMAISMGVLMWKEENCHIYTCEYTYIHPHTYMYTTITHNNQMEKKKATNLMGGLEKGSKKETGEGGDRRRKRRGK